MKGWKETYTNIVLNEKLGRKSLRLVKDLEKAIDKTGDLIKQLPDDLEDSESYQELSQGQNSLEYGIRFLEEDLESLDEVKEEVQEVSEAKEFNRVKEVNAVKKIDKLLEQAYKEMNKLQYGKSLYMREVNDGIVLARRSLNEYKLMAGGGDLDGPLERWKSF